MSYQSGTNPIVLCQLNLFPADGAPVTKPSPSPINPSLEQFTKDPRRLPCKGAAAALIMIGLASPAERLTVVDLPTRRFHLGQPAMYIPPTCYKEMRYRAAEPMGDCGVMFPAFNR
eukprot:scaffold10696_cov79-Skeletonema_dohrnii-CCMP3373.AAC.2